MCRFVGLMSCSGEGHSRQFISSRLETNVNTTHTLQDAQKHNMVACVSTEGFKEKTLGKGRFERVRLNFLIQHFKSVAFCTFFCVVLGQ